MRVLLFGLVLFTLFSCSVFKIADVKPDQFIQLKIKETSDLCIDVDFKSFYMVSDNGLLYQTDLQGNVLRQAAIQGIDFEGVYSDSNYVYVLDETARKIIVINKSDLSVHRTVHIPYSGGRNKGYESITFNQARGVFIIITEKEPVYIFELDAQLNKVNEILLPFNVRDISGVTFHKNYLWFLSDEDRTVFQVNPNTYEKVNSWLIPVINPEGIAFDQEDNLYILSDDMERLYIFKSFKF